MEYKKYAIEKTKDNINDINSIIKYRTNDRYFTRNRKMNFEKVVMYNINKRGKTAKMEIEDFNDFVDSKDISSVGVLKQRKKLKGEIYLDMMKSNLKDFYTLYPNDVKLFKGYIVSAIDGSDFEIPNTEVTRKNYNSTKDNTSVARAHVSNAFDVLT